MDGANEGSDNEQVSIQRTYNLYGLILFFEASIDSSNGVTNYSGRGLIQGFLGLFKFLTFLLALYIRGYRGSLSW